MVTLSVQVAVASDLDGEDSKPNDMVERAIFQLEEI